MKENDHEPMTPICSDSHPLDKTDYAIDPPASCCDPVQCCPSS